MIESLSYYGDTLVVSILLAVLLTIPIGMSIAAVIRSRRLAHEAGYRGILEHLRATPRNDQEKRQAVAMMMRGLVICMLGMVLQPLILFGLFPLYYGSRKVALAVLGIDLLGEADDADSPA